MVAWCLHYLLWLLIKLIQTNRTLVTTLSFVVFCIFPLGYPLLKAFGLHFCENLLLSIILLILILMYVSKLKIFLYISYSILVSSVNVCNYRNNYAYNNN